jgi:mannose-6-phosphate isomerase class I
MHGKLDDVALSEVLSQIEFNEKSGTLRVIGEDERGLIAFNGGRPLWAQFSKHRDADAVFEMVRLKKGEFSFMAAIEPGEQTIHGSVTGLLLEVSRRLDED